MAFDLRRGFPFGLICLALLYANAVLVVKLISPNECMEEPCSSEGGDTTTLAWATSFFNAFIVFALAFQLECFPTRPVYFTATLVQYCFGFAFVARGLGQSFFANSGFDDNAGQQLFYIVWSTSVLLMTAGIAFGYIFLHQIMAQYSSTYKLSLCLKSYLQLTFALVVLSGTIAAGGYIWCATDESIHVDGNVDAVEPLVDDAFGVAAGDSLHQCLRIGIAGETFWYFGLALFSLPVSRVVLGVIKSRTDQPRFALGLKNSWVPFLLVAVSWTFGAMLVVWMGVASYFIDSFDTLSQTEYGTVIFNFGMLVTLALWHNLGATMPKEDCALPTINEKGTDESDRDTTDENSLAMP